MKKNKMMRVASMLLVAVLLSTSVISGTFAKYVTEGSSAQSARVAKFGVVVSASGDLFSKTYVNKAGGNTPGSASITVESSDTSNVVAPGTKSLDTGLTFGVTGTPEVTTAVTVTAEYVDNKDIFLKAGTYTDVTGAGASFAFEGEDYKPVKWTLKKDGAAVTGCEGVSLTAINAYFAQQATAGSLTYAPKTDLSSATGFGNYVLTWEWDFGSTANDKKDTVLGDLAAGTPAVKKGAELNEDLVKGTDYQTDISVKVTINVAQVD